MADRITNRDLAGMLERYKRALDSLGITLAEGERLEMSEGSKTYGIAFRLYTTGVPGIHGEGGTGHGRPPVGDDFLGMTKREAYDMLAERCRTMEDVAYATEARERLAR